MVKIKKCKMPKSCSECEFIGFFNADMLKQNEKNKYVTETGEGDKVVFGCMLTPMKKDMTHDPRFGVRLIENVWKRPKWCRLKRSLF